MNFVDTWVVRNVVGIIIVHGKKLIKVLIRICRATNVVDSTGCNTCVKNIINLNRGLQNNCMPIITKTCAMEFSSIIYEYSKKIKYLVPNNGGFWSSAHLYNVSLGLSGSCWCQRTLSLQQLAVYQIRHKVKKESSWALLLFS